MSLMPVINKHVSRMEALKAKIFVFIVKLRFKNFNIELLMAIFESRLVWCSVAF